MQIRKHEPKWENMGVDICGGFFPQADVIWARQFGPNSKNMSANKKYELNHWLIFVREMRCGPTNSDAFIGMQTAERIENIFLSKEYVRKPENMTVNIPAMEITVSAMVLSTKI